MEIGAILFEITRIIGFLRTLLIRLEMENSFACRCQTGITAFITLIDLEIAVFRRESNSSIQSSLSLGNLSCLVYGLTSSSNSRSFSIQNLWLLNFSLIFHNLLLFVYNCDKSDCFTAFSNNFSKSAAWLVQVKKKFQLELLVLFFHISLQIQNKRLKIDSKVIVSAINDVIHFSEVFWSTFPQKPLFQKNLKEIAIFLEYSLHYYDDFWNSSVSWKQVLFHSFELFTNFSKLLFFSCLLLIIICVSCWECLINQFFCLFCCYVFFCDFLL